MSNVIYIGANLRREGVMTNQLFTAYPLDLVTRLSEKYPLINLLFVPVEELGAASKEVKTTGSARAVAYAQTKRNV